MQGLAASSIKYISGISRKIIPRTFCTAQTMSQSKVAVVLSGSGVYDGTELHEASAVFVHLSRAGADVSFFAPDVNQMHVINHLKGEPADGEVRNVLVESARIARGAVTSLSELNSGNFDAVVFPGGFGAAKNLSNFAVKGADCTVNADVERVLKDFHQAKKPIGLCCIAPVLAAKVLPGVSVTVGSDTDDGGRWPHAGTAGAINQMGGCHVNKNVTEAQVDAENKVVTAPAYMCNTKVHEVYDGIGEMITNVLKLC